MLVLSLPFNDGYKQRCILMTKKYADSSISYQGDRGIKKNIKNTFYYLLKYWLMLGVSGINIWRQRRREIPSCWQHSTCWAPTWEGWSKVADQASDGRDVKKIYGISKNLT